MQIAIAVHSSSSRDTEEKVARFINSLDCKPTILVGGYWGLMKTVVDEALKRGFKVTVFLPIEREDIDLPENVIRVNTGCEFRCRSVMLVRSSDVLVSLGGEVGTMIEIFMAYAMGKPLFVLSNTGLSSDVIVRAFPEYIDQRKVTKPKYFDSPEELAKEVCKPQVSIKTSYG